MNLSEVTTPARHPEYKHDAENKVYIVYDELGKEQFRFPYKDIWNSSPAMRDAERAVNKIRFDIQNRVKINWENQPITKNEQEYMSLDNKCKKYMNTIRDGILDDDTKQLYYEQMIVWNERMDYLVNTHQVRNSIIMETYKLS